LVEVASIQDCGRKYCSNFCYKLNFIIDKNPITRKVENINAKTILFVSGEYFFHLLITSVIEVVAMEPEEYKGFMIFESPGWMFKATKIAPSALFKHPLNACTVKSLKIFIDFKLSKIKPTNRYKPFNEHHG